MYVWPHTYIHTSVSTYIHTHHILYILTVMDPYTHILCLPLTCCCQTIFISGYSEVMTSVCPFLITWTARPWAIQNESYNMVVHIYTGDMYIHSNTPFRVRIQIHIRKETYQCTLFVRIQIQIQSRILSLKSGPWNDVFSKSFLWRFWCIYLYLYLYIDIYIYIYK